jgi:hypothetical protein
VSARDSPRILLLEPRIVKGRIIAELGEEIPVVGFCVHERILMYEIGPSADIKHSKIFSMLRTSDLGYRQPTLEIRYIKVVHHS